MYKTIHSENPYVCTYDNMLTDKECKHFINLSKDKLTTRNGMFRYR